MYVAGITREERKIGESLRKVVCVGLGLRRKVCLTGETVSLMLLSVCRDWRREGVGKVGKSTVTFMLGPLRGILGETGVDFG